MTNKPTTKDLTITRIFDAPRELVFNTWIDPKHLAQWWGPRYFTNPTCEVDPRPGGKIYIVMTDPNGVEYPMRGTFREVVPPERLVFTSIAVEDKSGNVLMECLNTVTFDDLNGKTKLTMHASLLKVVETPEVAFALSGMEQGWNESLDKLNETVQQIVQQSQSPSPKPGLKTLDRLVGTWNISGPDITGQVRFEWMEGGFFLMQHVDMVHGGHKIKGIEIIGYERGWETMMGQEVPKDQDITSHWFDNEGNTFTYTWEIENDTLTIWGGSKGSPSFYKGEFSADGNVNSGAWQWPGGGYESTMTRVK